MEIDFEQQKAGAVTSKLMNMGAHLIENSNFGGIVSTTPNTDTPQGENLVNRQLFIMTTSCWPVRKRDQRGILPADANR